MSANGVRTRAIEDLGNAETLLSNRTYLTDTASKLLHRGIMPIEDGWGGWLGRYQTALTKTASEIIQRAQKIVARNHGRDRYRECSLGR